MKSVKSNKFITYRIIFVPDRKLSMRSIKLAQEVILSKKVYFAVNNSKYFPHLTVYKAEFPVSNKKVIFEGLESFSKQQKPFILTFNKIYSAWGWLGIDFKRTAGIIRIHKTILDLLNPLREGHIREKYLEELKTNKYSPSQKRNILEYGYPLVLSEYRPHLTLARFVDSRKADRIKDNLNNKKIGIGSGTINSIAVVTGGEHGVVSKFIKTYKLLV